MERKNIFFFRKFHVGGAQRVIAVMCPALRFLWFLILTQSKKNHPEVVTDLFRGSGLSLTTQNKTAGWERDCDTGRDQPPFCFRVTKLMCIFCGQAWFGSLFHVTNKTNRKSDTQKGSEFWELPHGIVTKETNYLVFMCSADGRAESPG